MGARLCQPLSALERGKAREVSGSATARDEECAHELPFHKSSAVSGRLSLNFRVLGAYVGTILPRMA